MTEFSRNIINDKGKDQMPVEKCESCSMQKRVLFDYKTKFGKSKRICKNCLMYHIFFDDISEFKNAEQMDIFARLNAFYSYKSHQKEQNFFKLLLRYLWSIEDPNITKIKELWNRHYKTEKDKIENYIKRFQEIGILGEIKPNDDGIEIASWGPKINLLIQKWVDAKERNDIDSWYYNIANIIKSAETLVGMSTELDRTTFDKNRNAIMKMFSKHCCDKDGYILEEYKKYTELGYRCRYVDDDGSPCNKEFDHREDVFIHLDEHNIAKERKEEFYEPINDYVGVWLRTKDMAEQSDKISYTNWQHAVNAILKAQDFVIDLGKNEWLIEASVADAMEKALIKSKELIKEKEKVKEK